MALLLSVCCVLTACGGTDETVVESTTETEEIVETEEVEIASESLLSSGAIVTTGQTATYDGDGNVIETSLDDAFYGQDGDYESVDFSFTVNDDGTTYDNNTGLTWVTIPDGGKMTWEEAVEYCENLTLGGYDDWRLPTVEELFSISDFEEGWPYLDTEYFGFDESESAASGMGDGSPQGGSPQGGASEGGEMPEGVDLPEMAEGEMAQGGAPQGGSPQGGASEGGEMPEGVDLPEMAEGNGSMAQGGSPQGGSLEGREMPEGVDLPEMTEGNGGMAQGGSSQGGSPQGGASEGGEMPEGEMAPPMEEGGEGGVSKEEGQYWTSEYNQVEGDERLGNIAFGVNHATGHIKAYPSDSAQMGKYVRAVRGDVYGAEDYTDNGDGTITDNESGLMWLEVDLGVAVDWEEALSLAESSEFAGYDDWRLPDVKELQSIVNYGGSYPAINQDYFTCTELEENENYYYWTSTSAYFSASEPDYNSAWYVAFGYTSHGAGAVRFSPKYEGSDALSEGEDNILNSVRLVRNVE